jgi:hypothetical protein
MNRAAIREALERLRQRRIRGRRKPGRPSIHDQAAILAAYVAGEKIEAIAALHGVSPPYPGMLAKRRGLPARGQGRRL